MIQDFTSMTVIGASRLIDGFYCLQQLTNSSITWTRTWTLHTTTISPNLLHQRLGYPSSSALKYIPGISLSSSSPLSCSICFIAKQTHTPFTNSTSIITIFYLIHCDLWGPYQYPISCGSVCFFSIIDDISRAIWV